jgi:hypothetical protein
MDVYLVRHAIAHERNRTLAERRAAPVDCRRRADIPRGRATLIWMVPPRVLRALA